MSPRKAYETELVELDNLVAEMAKKTQRGDRARGEVVREARPGHGDEGQELDEELYCLNIDIEKRCLEVIALQSPVAKDLQDDRHLPQGHHGLRQDRPLREGHRRGHGPHQGHGPLQAPRQHPPHGGDGREDGGPLREGVPRAGTRDRRRRSSSSRTRSTPSTTRSSGRSSPT